MQQILKFKIELFDTRMRSSITVVDDSALVRSIQINKGTSLDNTATITFAKSKTYDLIGIETILKLYNYVKIELKVTSYNPDHENYFWFSGFIQTINKVNNFGSNPGAAVVITIADYANLMKTTFYTKNLTFLEILNQAVPEFRMINLTEYFGDASRKLLDNFYSPTQLGFIFFAFLYFKFMYKIVYNEDGSSKKTKAPDSREIYKKFKIYLPFGFEVNNSKSLLDGQQQSLTIYKQLQGVALDLFKYIYPEPIFEFTTFETYDTVILMIRFTPLMKFDRPLTQPQSLTVGPAYSDWGVESYNTDSFRTQEFSFDSNSYNTIERYEFGHNRIRSVRESSNVSPAALLRKHLEEDDPKDPKRIITTIQNALNESKNLTVDDLIANDDEADEITDNFFNVIPIDTRFLESMNMQRSANSVVNVIWTVPTTDTAILKLSGRELVYAYLEQRLQEVGGSDKFGNYVYRQFEEDFDANPIFLMDYRGVYGSSFVSGDMNYFGFREFEIKWNYLSVNYNTTAYILAKVDKNVLAEARANSKDKTVIAMIDAAMRANSDAATQSSTAKLNPRKTSGAKIFTALPDLKTTSVFDIPYSTKAYRQSSRAGFSPKPVKNKLSSIEKVRQEDLFNKAIERYSKEGVIDKNSINNPTKIIELLNFAKAADAKLMGGFVSKINRVIAEAYRENEHLYECNILKPIDITILPGMIVESSSESKKAQSPRFKGYVTSISHTIDFNAATMKTSMNLSRVASDDSGVVGDPVGPD